MSTETLDRPDTKPSTGRTDDEVFHYARKDAIARAAVEGGMVTALCGEQFPVTRAPKPGSAVCDVCKQLFEMLPPPPPRDGSNA